MQQYLEQIWVEHSSVLTCLKTALITIILVFSFSFFFPPSLTDCYQDYFIKAGRGVTIPPHMPCFQFFPLLFPFLLFFSTFFCFPLLSLSLLSLFLFPLPFPPLLSSHFVLTFPFHWCGCGGVGWGGTCSLW